MDLKNYPYLWKKLESPREIDLGQRMMIPDLNCTGRYVGNNEVVYKKHGEMIKIGSRKERSLDLEERKKYERLFPVSITLEDLK